MDPEASSLHSAVGDLQQEWAARLREQHDDTSQDATDVDMQRALAMSLATSYEAPPLGELGYEPRYELPGVEGRKVRW